MASLGQMARDLMACSWSHGRKVNPFVGMWRSSAHWSTLTCSLQPPPPVLLPSLPPPARSRNTAHWKTSIFQPIAVESLGSMNCDARKFLAALGRRISRELEMAEKSLFCFSVLLFCYFGLILFSYTTVWVGWPPGALYFFLSFFNF